MKLTLSFKSYILLFINCILIVSIVKGEPDPSNLKATVNPDNIISVGIITPEMPIDNELVIGKINKSQRKLSDSNFKAMIGNVINLDHTIIQTFQNSYIVPFYDSRTYSNYSGIIKPKIFFKPIITFLNLDLQGGKYLKTLSGKCNMTCTWNIYAANDKSKIISSISINSLFEKQTDTYELFLHELMRQSVKDLLKIDTLHSYLEDLQIKYLEETIGKPLAVNGYVQKAVITKKDALKLGKDASVTIIMKNGFGSGVVISSEGFIITNYHVIADSGEVKVRFNDGVEVKAEILKTNPEFDLALLKVKSKTEKWMSLCKENNITEGDQVYAIGTPLDKSFNQTITGGIISGKRELNTISLIQTDVTLNEGNSGGPVINEAGEVVGIATMKLSGEGIEGIGFCIPSTIVIHALNLQLMK